MFYDEKLEDASYNVAMIEELFFKQSFRFTKKLRAKEMNFAVPADTRDQSPDNSESALMDNSSFNN